MANTLLNISHLIIVKLKTATNLDPNDDFMGSKPDTYVVLNALKQGTKRLECVSTAKSDVEYATNEPTWEKSFRLSLSGSGLVTINVFSKHYVTADTLIGQAFVDLDDLSNLTSGCSYEFSMDLTSPKIPIYDSNGILISSANDKPSGSISFSIQMPSVFQNMCGWFYDIKSSFFGVISGERMWVVLNRGFIYCYDSPFEGHLQQVIECSKITVIEEVVYDKLEITLQGLTLNLSDGAKFVWGWGDDAKKAKGLWRQALCAHISYQN